MSPHSRPVGLFDSHAHLDASEFDGDRARVLAAARAAGVRQVLVPAVARRDWSALGRLCAEEDGLYPAYGLHPCYLDEQSESDIAGLGDWLAGHRAHAVGECGLDFMEPESTRERQVRVLHAHFAVARRLDLPLVLHARRAFEAVILELKAFGKPLRGVVHSFSGSLEQARRLQELGFMVGIGGPVTHARAKRLRRVVAELPVECLLLETDSPDQPSASRQGQRNEPAFLPEILECVAALRGADPAALAEATTRNARRLFAT